MGCAGGMRKVPLTLVHVVVTPSWGPAPWLLSNDPLPLPAEEDPDIRQHFRPRRHLISAPQWRTEMTNRFAVWDEITVAAAA